MNVESRRRAVVSHDYCLNCLARSHKTAQCTSLDLCQRCGKEHHTLLHVPLQKRLRAQDPVRRHTKPRTPPKPQPAKTGTTPRRTHKPKYINAGRNDALSSPAENQRCLQVALRALERLQRAL